MQTNATAAIVNVARVIATVHLSLLRRGQKEHNPSREVLENHRQQSQQGRLGLGLRLSD
jgi:hypothetical protein